VRKLFQVALLFALAAAAGMSVLMPQINWLLFNDSLGSVTLAVNSLMIPLATLVILDNVLLQSQNRQFRVVLIISAMILLKLILNYPLVFYFGIVGGAAASDLALLAAGLIGGYLVTDIGFSYLKNGNWRKYLAVVVPMIVVVKIVSWLMELIIVPNRFNNIYVLTVSILCGVGIFVGLSIKYKLLDLKNH
uniref:polysaccharide biosynthesis C-terminal domain-containing protein n=1 Tax=Liquorilactobacillus vini TaxID=238015 RepID=UPI0011476EBE